MKEFKYRFNLFLKKNQKKTPEHSQQSDKHSVSCSLMIPAPQNFKNKIKFMNQITIVS